MTVVRVVARGVWPVPLLLAVWWAWVVGTDVPPAVAPNPSRVLSYFAGHAGSFVSDATNTVYVVVVGLAIGMLAGVGLAAVSWFSPAARSAISTPAVVTQCIPVATMVPVLARMFGYTQHTIIVIAALICFFPALVFTAAGLRNTPAGTGDLFVVFGARRWHRFRHLALPSAVPQVLVALRLSVVAAVVGSLLAQWVMGTRGLGYRLVVAQASFRTDEAWCASLVAVLVSIVLFGAVSALCRIALERFQ